MGVVSSVSLSLSRSLHPKVIYNLQNRVHNKIIWWIYSRDIYVIVSQPAPAPFIVMICILGGSNSSGTPTQLEPSSSYLKE